MRCAAQNCIKQTIQHYKLDEEVYQIIFVIPDNVIRETDSAAQIDR